MNRIFIQFVVLFLTSLFFTSCLRTNSGFQSSPVISRNVTLDPIKADINVDLKAKIKGESSSTYFYFLELVAITPLLIGLIIVLMHLRANYHNSIYLDFMFSID